MNVVVLCGGLSSERDVSLKSGSMVAKALRENGHKVLLLDVFMGYKDAECDITGIFENSEKESLQVAEISAIAPDIDAVKASRADKSASFFGPNVIRICQMADVVFMALHGSDGENGKVQAAFDLHGIKYTGNDYLSSALAMDKDITKRTVAAYDVPMAEGFATDANERRMYEGKFPCIVKPACGGSSIGVTIVNNKDEYEAALDAAFEWEDKVVVEQFIKGREFSCGIIKGKALPVIEIAPKQGFYDYKNKYAAGSAVETCPAEIPEEISKAMQEYTARAYEALGLSVYARMDFLTDEDMNVYFLEANTLPGMTPTSLMPQEAAVIGYNYNQLCELIIKESLAKYE